MHMNSVGILKLLYILFVIHSVISVANTLELQKFEVSLYKSILNSSIYHIQGRCNPQHIVIIDNAINELHTDYMAIIENLQLYTRIRIQQKIFINFYSFIQTFIDKIIIYHFVDSFIYFYFHFLFPFSTFYSFKDQNESKTYIMKLFHAYGA